MSLRRLATALLLSAPACALAAPAEASATAFWAFYAENDLFAPTQDDNAYTGGLALSLSGPRSAAFFLSPDPLLGAVNRLLPMEGLRADAGPRFHSLELGVAGFTPRDTETAAPVPDQHPYACLTFLNSSRLDVEPGERSAWLSSLSLGLLGTDLCEDIQTAVHRANGNSDAQGWANQISDGGEPTGQWRLSRLGLMSSGGVGAGRTDLAFHLETAFGFATHLGAGLNWRRGRIRSPWWSATPHHAEYISLGDPAPAGGPGEWYLFAGFKVQYRLYNALVQGQFRESAVTFSQDELQPLVREAWGGVAASVGRNFELSLRWHARDGEIRGRPSASWGSIRLRRRFR